MKYIVVALAVASIVTATFAAVRIGGENLTGWELAAAAGHEITANDVVPPLIKAALTVDADVLTQYAQ